MGLFSRIRDFLAGLVKSRQIASAMQTTFKLPEDMMGMIEVWQDAYMARADDGGSDQHSGLASMMANDLARKAMSELRVASSRAGVSEYPLDIFDDDGLLMLRSQVEYAIAMGGVLMRPVYRDGQIVEEWYTPDRIIPTDWDRRTMTGVTLVDYFIQTTSGGVSTTYAKLESHGWDGEDGRWHIRTKAFKDFGFASGSGLSFGAYVGTEVPLSDIPQWADIDPDVTIEDARCPTFVYIGTPFANNKVFNQPLGVSIFKDALPWLDEFERAFTSARHENRHGRSRLFVADSMIGQTYIPGVDGSKGIMVDDLDVVDREFIRKLETESSDRLFEEWAPTLRFESFENYMNFLLHMVCLTCGLDPGQYVFDEKSYAVTAKEVVSKQQKTYTTICDIQRYMVVPAVSHIVECVRQAQLLYDLPAIPDDIEVACDFGDSILTDEDAERQNALLEVNSGLRSRLSYLITQRHLTEEEAMKELERIADDEASTSPRVPDAFGEEGA